MLRGRSPESSLPSEHQAAFRDHRRWPAREPPRLWSAEPEKVHHDRVLEDPSERAPWSVRTAAYYYSLDNADDREIISYHWHPESQSPIQFPHPHLGPG